MAFAGTSKGQVNLPTGTPEDIAALAIDEVVSAWFPKESMTVEGDLAHGRTYRFDDVDRIRAGSTQGQLILEPINRWQPDRRTLASIADAIRVRATVLTALRHEMGAPLRNPQALLGNKDYVEVLEGCRQYPDGAANLLAWGADPDTTRRALELAAACGVMTITCDKRGQIVGAMATPLGGALIDRARATTRSVSGVPAVQPAAAALAVLGSDAGWIVTAIHGRLVMTWADLLTMAGERGYPPEDLSKAVEAMVGSGILRRFHEQLWITPAGYDLLGIVSDLPRAEGLPMLGIARDPTILTDVDKLNWNAFAERWSDARGSAGPAIIRWAEHCVMSALQWRVAATMLRHPGYAQEAIETSVSYMVRAAHAAPAEFALAAERACWDACVDAIRLRSVDWACTLAARAAELGAWAPQHRQIDAPTAARWSDALAHVRRTRDPEAAAAIEREMRTCLALFPPAPVTAPADRVAREAQPPARYGGWGLMS